MKTAPAAMLFLGACSVLAVLLIMQVISPVAGSVMFAIALVTFGGLSHGFRRR